MPTTWEPEILAIVAATFVVAGLVKGVIGLGLPTVALALLTATLGLREAMVLMLVPSLVTNLWQGLAGGHLTDVLRRFWTLLLAGCLGVWATAGLLSRADTALLAALLGLLLCLYAGLGLVKLPMPPAGRRERLVSPLIGAVSGLLTGLTGTFVVPAVPYFQSLALRRDELIQAMGVWFTVATLALGIALQRQDLMPPDLGWLSAVGLLPALLGMALGQRLRRRLSEARFRQVFFASLLLLGVYIVVRALA